MTLKHDQNIMKISTINERDKMKYLVTWHQANDPADWAGGCRYYNDRLEAYTDYKHFKSNSNFHNVHFLEIQEKEDKEEK